MSGGGWLSAARSHDAHTKLLVSTYLVLKGLIVVFLLESDHFQY